MEWILVAIAGANALATVLMWVAKIRWSREYRDATEKMFQSKETEIQSKDAQIAVLKEEIAFLKDITPTKLMREYIVGLKSQLDEVDQQLKNERAQAFITTLLNAQERQQLEAVNSAIGEGANRVFLLLAHAFRVIYDFGALKLTLENLAYYIGTGAESRIPNSPGAIAILKELEAIGKEVVTASRSIEQVFINMNSENSADPTFSWVPVPDEVRTYRPKSERIFELYTLMRERLDELAQETSDG